QSCFPVDARLEAQMEYCATHQLRIHTRWGSYPVDSQGSYTCLPKDIVDGHSVRLGNGWHAREAGGEIASYRWASDRAELILDTQAAGVSNAALLDVELEPNPFDRSSWWSLSPWRINARLPARGSRDASTWSCHFRTQNARTHV